jgi:hypothetical protein
VSIDAIVGPQNLYIEALMGTKHYFCDLRGPPRPAPWTPGQECYKGYLNLNSIVMYNSNLVHFETLV